LLLQRKLLEASVLGIAQDRLDFPLEPRTLFGGHSKATGTTRSALSALSATKATLALATLTALSATLTLALSALATLASAGSALTLALAAALTTAKSATLPRSTLSRTTGPRRNELSKLVLLRFRDLQLSLHVGLHQQSERSGEPCTHSRARLSRAALSAALSATKSAALSRSTLAGASLGKYARHQDRRQHRHCKSPFHRCCLLRTPSSAPASDLL
jgi:hypothetical protein